MKMQTVLVVIAGAVFAAIEPTTCLGQEKKKDASPSDKQPKPRFEPREKFEPEAGEKTQAQPAQGAYVGQQGTFRLCGRCGAACFQWPVGGKKLCYQETMEYRYSTKEAHVYKLCGRYHRVYFAFESSPGKTGEHQIWVRNGDKPWRAYGSAKMTK